MKYKLYKAGKFIVTASIMLGSVMMISQGDAHADTEDSNCLSDTTQVERSQEKPSNSVTLSTNGVASEDNPEVLNSEEKEISSGDNSDVTSDASPENDGTTSTSAENEIPDTTTSADSISNPSETSDTESEPEQTTVDTETKADSEPDKSVNSSQDSDKDLQAVTVKPDIESTKPTENDTNEQKVTYSVQAETRAVVKNGWVDGKYYINNVAATGFYTVSNKFYRFVDGVKQTGWQTRLNQNDWYYFGTDGVALSGLQHLDGGYKYFDASYVQTKNAWRTTGQNRWYFLNSYDGKAVIGLQQLDGGYKYFDNNGIQAKNDWRTTGQNRWYFLSSYDGKAVTGLQVLDGRTKYFDDNGIQVKNQWRNLPGRSIHTNSYDGVVDITTLSHTWYSQLNQGAPEGCEATALQIALSVKGRWASLQDIYNRTGYGWYGNPDSNFYGNPWGGGTGTTQTVTARRLAEATKSIYGGIENLVSASVADIEREIGLGNAVVTWGDYTWRLNQAFHVMTIVGMNQDSFLISDPYSTVNKEYWISKGTWSFINGNESANGWNLPKMMNVVVR